MTRSEQNPKYDTNKSIRERIDKKLKECATIYANLGMKNKYDVGTLAKARTAEKKLLREIKELSPFFFDRIKQA